jgi:hypothetical protein
MRSVDRLHRLNGRYKKNNSWIGAVCRCNGER